MQSKKDKWQRMLVMYQFFLSEKGAPQTVKDVEMALEKKGIEVGKRDIQRDLADMKNAGFLESFGNHQNLKYQLSANQPMPMFEKINVHNLKKITRKLSIIINALQRGEMLKVEYTTSIRKCNKKYDTFIRIPSGEIKILDPSYLVVQNSELYIRCSEAGEKPKLVPLTYFEDKIVTSVGYV